MRSQGNWGKRSNWQHTSHADVMQADITEAIRRYGQLITVTRPGVPTTTYQAWMMPQGDAQLSEEMIATEGIENAAAAMPTSFYIEYGASPAYGDKIPWAGEIYKIVAVQPAQLSTPGQSAALTMGYKAVAIKATPAS